MSTFTWIVLAILYAIFFRNLPGGYIICIGLTGLRTYFLPKIKKITDECVLHFHVWFCDIDHYGHMNNCVYNTYCDYGRYALGYQTFGRKTLNHLYCVVAESNIQYIRPLKLFQPFTLRTSIVAMNHKNVWFKQVFESRGKVCAIAMMRMVFLNDHYHSLDFNEAFTRLYPSIEWNFAAGAEEYTTKEFKDLPSVYTKLTNTVDEEVAEEYKNRGMSMIIHSNRSPRTPVDNAKPKTE